MAYVKFNTSVKSKATDTSVIPVTDGQFLIVTDTKQLMYDFGATRITLGDIIELDTEAERVALLTPLDKFYFVKDTKVLWRYTSGAWQSWADATTVSNHVSATILSTDGVHGLRYDATNSVLQYKDANNKWVTIPMGGSSTAVTTMLTAAGWSAGRQTVSVSGLAADTNGIVGLTQDVTTAQYEAACNAMLLACGQAAGALTIAANGDVPAIDIPIAIILFA